jgi:hypothetical protein
MAKTFSVKISTSPEHLLQKASEIASRKGAKFRGDTSSGCFEGHGVAGEYQVEGNTMQVTINKKPFIAPWSVVESTVKGFFE